jgi:hypothetical protein
LKCVSKEGIDVIVGIAILGIYLTVDYGPGLDSTLLLLLLLLFLYVVGRRRRCVKGQCISIMDEEEKKYDEATRRGREENTVGGHPIRLHQGIIDNNSTAMRARCASMLLHADAIEFAPPSFSRECNEGCCDSQILLFSSSSFPALSSFGRLPHTREGTSHFMTTFDKR